MEHTGKRALVLAGGGAKGSYQIGVWRALQELDWTPDIITGASVGTLNGCLFTMGKIQEAEDLWRSLEIHDVLEVPATLKPEELRAFFLDIIRSGGLNVEPLAEMIDRLIKEGKAKVDVLDTKDTWSGVTYQEDKEVVIAAFDRLAKEGVYPETLYK